MVQAACVVHVHAASKRANKAWTGSGTSGEIPGGWISQLERPTLANSCWIEVTSFTKGTSLACTYVLAPKAAEGAPKAAGRGAPVRAAI